MRSSTVCIFRLNFQCDFIHEDQIDRICSTRGVNEKLTQNFSQEILVGDTIWETYEWTEA
jgi:hypothetical protein